MRRIFYSISSTLLLCGASPTFKVMVIDTGIDVTHPALTKYVPEKLRTTPDFTDTHGHGTHISGLITADACPGVELYSCKFYDSNAVGDENLRRTVECFNRAREEGMDLINYSAGGAEPSRIEKLAVEQFCNLPGRTFVSAAGNEGWNLDRIPYYPASYRFACQVTVSSLGKNGKLMPSSNWASWTKQELGMTVKSSLPGGRYGYMSGSSQAAAIYSGKVVKSFCESQKKALTPEKVSDKFGRPTQEKTNSDSAESQMSGRSAHAGSQKTKSKPVEKRDCSQFLEHLSQRSGLSSRRTVLPGKTRIQNERRKRRPVRVVR